MEKTKNFLVYGPGKKEVANSFAESLDDYENEKFVFETLVLNNESAFKKGLFIQVSFEENVIIYPCSSKETWLVYHIYRRERYTNHYSLYGDKTKLEEAPKNWKELPGFIKAGKYLVQEIYNDGIIVERTAYKYPQANED